MSTNQYLQRINDSDFEALATLCLRRLYPELQELIPTGLNEDGKPIPYPVDGILYVSGSPSKCIAVATTTTGPKDLRQKWLARGKGDIDKAYEELKSYARDSRTIKYVLYLVTNQSISREGKLYKDVMREAESKEIELHLIEQTILTDFLDNKPEGQYLRWHFFQIPIHQLSASLLREVGIETLKHHKHMFGLQAIATDIEIVRDAREAVLEKTRNISLLPIAIQGAAGTGKSTLLRQVGEALNASDGVALWISAEKLEDSTTLVGLLSDVLSEFYPSLNIGHEEELIKIASQFATGVTLLIDDVNRLNNPEKALNTIKRWALLNTQRVEQSAIATRVKIQLVVPIWPEIVKDYDTKTSWDTVELQSYSAQEQTNLATKLNETNKSGDRRRIVESIGGDPFLTGLALGRLRPFTSSKLSVIIRESVEDLIIRLSEDVASAENRTKTTAGELIEALDYLIEQTIVRQESHIAWRDLSSEKAASLLRIWSEHKCLGWIAKGEYGEYWRWKHNRLRDMLLGRHLARHVENQNWESDGQLEIWLSNPGSAEAWAISIAFLQTEDLQKELLKLFSQYNPLALAEILRLGLFPEEEVLRRTIADSLNSYFEEANKPKIGVVDDTLYWELLSKLALTDDSIIIELTEKAKKTHISWAARLRNGVVTSGLDWVAHLEKIGFPPRSQFPFLHQTLEAFEKNLQSRFTVIQDLEQSIKDEKYLSPTLIFAGYLGWRELFEPLALYWSSLSLDKQLETLAQFIWMISRSGDTSVQQYLEYALSLINFISDEGQAEGKGSDRYYRILMPLDFAFRNWEITSLSAKRWAECARKMPELERDLCYIMRVIDQPETAQAYIEWCVRTGHAFHGELGQAINPRYEDYFEKPHIGRNHKTREHLWHLIINSQDENLRKWLFRYWKPHATKEDLEKLWSIGESDQLFDEALKMRLKLLDSSATDLFLQRMPQNHNSWFIYLSFFIDEQKFYQTFIENLEEALKTAFAAETAIQYLPEWAMEDLIDEKRDLLLNSPITWHYLWKSDLPIALELVRKAIAEAETDKLKYFFIGDKFPYPVSQQMLDALVPVLKCFEIGDLEHFIENALYSGFEDWIKSHGLDAVLSEPKFFHWMTEESIHNILDAALQQLRNGLDLWTAKDVHFLVSSDIRRYGMNTIQAMKTWLGDTPEPEQIIVASFILKETGTPVVLPWWKKYEPEEQMAHLAWSRAFNTLRRKDWQS